MEQIYSNIRENEEENPLHCLHFSKFRFARQYMAILESVTDGWKTQNFIYRYIYFYILVLR